MATVNADTDPVVDATVVDEQTDAGDHPPVRPASTALTIAPTVSAGELVTRLDMIRETQQKAMLPDVDYGVIPGTNKPTLLKPGAEKLGVLFQLDVQLVNEKTWGPDEHLTVTSKATVFHAPTGARLGYGEGICTTREKKYAVRKQERTCPTCGKAAVIKGKAEYGGGWLCWKKRDGCGAKFPDGDPQIESQEVGEIPNPDLPDLWNTIVKMAEKRARVDAVLAVTGASALFTQDAEDQAQPVDTPVSAGEFTVDDFPRRGSGKSDVTPDLLTYQQYQALRTAFKACQDAGTDPTSVVNAWLGEKDVPGPDMAHKIAALSPEQADELLDFLTGGGDSA